MTRLIELFRTHKDVISYLFFGGCSTAVDVLTFGLFSRVLHMGTVVSTCASWLVTVLFVYVTNRTWVFHSKAEGAREIVREFAYFMACRLATGALDVTIMWFSVDVMGLNGIVMKFLSNMIVIVLNFIASKLIVFRRT